MAGYVLLLLIPNKEILENYKIDFDDKKAEKAYRY